MARLLGLPGRTDELAGADRAVARFGSLARTLGGSPLQFALKREDREVPVRLRGAQSAAQIASREQIAGEPVDPTSPRLHLHLRETVGRSPSEKLHATFVDSARGFLGDCIVASGSETGVELSACELVRRVLEMGAAGVILAHNHPSGCCVPSLNDVVATRRLAVLLETLGILLVDHLIVGRKAVTSMRVGGYLDG